VAYQALSVAETYYTLFLLSPVRASFTSAIVLETVNRAVTMVFKVIPMRIGVDEASSSFAAVRLHLDPATGLALALVRKLRLLVLSALGLVFLVRQPARRPSPALRIGRIPAQVAVLIVLLAAGVASAQEGSSSIAGAASIVGPDGAAFTTAGVTLTLTCPGREPRTEISDDQGNFRFGEVTTGTCSIAAELQGFRSATTTVHVKPGETTTVNVQLGLDTLREDVIVRAKATTADDGTSGPRVERVTRELIQNAPTVSARFQDALPLIPGVVRGPDGLLNINGSRTNQTALTFNNANGTDPVTGEDAIELPIDAVSSVRVRGAAYAPEFGLSAGAVTTVETLRPGDSWDVTVNDLEPRPRRRGGEFRGIESWTPRATIGGPIVKGKLNLLESVQFEYSQTQ